MIWNEGFLLRACQHLYLDLLLLGNAWTHEGVKRVLLFPRQLTRKEIALMERSSLFRPFTWVWSAQNWSVVVSRYVSTSYPYVTIWSVLLIAENEVPSVLNQALSDGRDHLRIFPVIRHLQLALWVVIIGHCVHSKWWRCLCWSLYLIHFILSSAIIKSLFKYYLK